MDDQTTIALPTERMIGRIEGAIGWMVFNNPERRNAMSIEMWAAIPLIMDRFEQDPAVRVIVLRGAGGKAFVSGADISQFEQQRSSPEAIAKYEQNSLAALRRIGASSKPVIAMIEGYCIGGGVGVAIECDLRIATTASKFGVPAARLGLGYIAPGIKKLMDIVGPAYAREIFLTARQFTAEEATGMGLINRAVPEAEVESYVRDYCARIAENAPLTMLAAKRTVTELLRGPEADIALCDQLVKNCFASEDYIEGRRAFMEKRKPAFKGR